MRPYRENMTVQGGGSVIPGRRGSTGRAPITVVVNGEAMSITLDTGLTHTKSAGGRANARPMNQPNG